MKKLLFIGAVALFALTGCKDAKQSELDFNAKAGKATVFGTVMYDYGVEPYYEGGYLYYKDNVLKAVPSGRIVAEIKYNEFDENAKGIRQVEGVIVDGNFSLSIPCDMDEVSMNIQVTNCVLTRQELDYSYVSPMPKQFQAWYTSEAQPVSVIANDIERVNIVMNTTDHL